MPEFQLETEPQHIGDRTNWASLVVRYPPAPVDARRIARNLWTILEGRMPHYVLPHLFMARVRSKEEWSWLRGQLERLLDHHSGSWKFVWIFHHRLGMVRPSPNLESEPVETEAEFLTIQGFAPPAEED